MPGQSAAVELLDRAAEPPPGAGPGLRIALGGGAWTLPLECVRGVMEAEGVTPLPLTGPPVEGIAGIGGRPVLRVDLARALGGGPGAGCLMVLAATPAGDVALRVDGARRTLPGEPEAEPLDLARLLPWTAQGQFRAARVKAPDPRNDSLAVLLAEQEGEPLAFTLDRIDRVARVEWSRPLGGPDWLVEVDGLLLHARRISSTADAGHAIVLRDGAGQGPKAALLVERALGVERCPAAQIAPVIMPDGGRTLWWRRPSAGAMPAEPVRILDPGIEFGWPAPEGGRLAATESAATSGAGAGDRRAEAAEAAALRAEVLVVEAGGTALALPLALVARIQDGVPDDDLASFDAGRLLGGRPALGAASVVLRGAGGADALRIVTDRALPLRATAARWQDLTALPAAPAALFDAAAWDGEAGRWLFRVRAAPRPAGALRRALAAARIRPFRRPFVPATPNP